MIEDYGGKTVVIQLRDRIHRTPYTLEEVVERIIDAGKAGKSMVEVCSALNITVAELKQLRLRYDDINYACELCATHSQAWWERFGREALIAGADFNATVYLFILKNRFRGDYGDAGKQLGEINEFNQLIENMTDEELLNTITQQQVITSHNVQ